MRLEPQALRAGHPEPRLSSRGGAERVVATPCHVVQFYETDAFLMGAVADFLGPPLAADEPVLVIATNEHLAGILARFEERKIDVQRALRQGFLTCLDAKSTLAALMIDETPDVARFHALVHPLLERCAALNGRGTVHAFGEMVELLAADGNISAAVRLESLWNELSSTYSIALLCGYSLNSFATEAHRDAFRSVC
jgi:hypothetical protein